MRDPGQMKCLPTSESMLARCVAGITDHAKVPEYGGHKNNFALDFLSHHTLHACLLHVSWRYEENRTIHACAVHAWIQYALSIDWRSVSSVSSMKKRGVDAPAHRKSASGQRPPCSAAASSRACSDSFADVRECESQCIFCSGRCFDF